MADEGLRKPRRKPKALIHLLESPFPVPIKTITGKESADNRWYYYFGILQSDHVSVSRLGDLTFLYRLGFFGRGVLSKSQPQFEKYKDVLSDHAKKMYIQNFKTLEPERRKPQMVAFANIMRERLRQHSGWVENKEFGDQVKSSTENEDATEASLLQCTDLHTEIDNELVEECSSDSDDIEDMLINAAVEIKPSILDVNNEQQDSNVVREDIKNIVEEDIGKLGNELPCSKVIKNENSHNCVTNQKGSSLKRPLSPTKTVSDKRVVLEDPYKLYECLQLTFEEAFFLSYGLGCLSVTEEDHPMNIVEMWSRFSSQKADFVMMYAAYHHFRSKGWVVRLSKIYGVDFVLYQDGMAFYHASYSVIVSYIREESLSQKDPQLSWKQLSSMCRVNERAGKEILFCYVVHPKDLNDEDLNSPSCIKHFKIMEVVMRRWLPEKYRESEG